VGNGDSNPFSQTPASFIAIAVVVLASPVFAGPGILLRCQPLALGAGGGYMPDPPSWWRGTNEVAGFYPEFDVTLLELGAGLRFLSEWFAGLDATAGRITGVVDGAFSSGSSRPPTPMPMLGVHFGHAPSLREHPPALVKYLRARCSLHPLMRSAEETPGVFAFEASGGVSTTRRWFSPELELRYTYAKGYDATLQSIALVLRIGLGGRWELGGDAD